MKLEDLVPPRELCQRIPAGAFADSALVWWGACVYPRLHIDGSRFGEPYRRPGALPAPTLAEIFAQLPQTSTVTWFTTEEYPNEFAVCCYVLQPKPRKPKLKSEIDDNPAVAVLKLWLELNERKEKNA